MIHIIFDICYIIYSQRLGCIIDKTDLGFSLSFNVRKMHLEESECYRNTQQSVLICFILNKYFKNIIDLIITSTSLAFKC